MPDVKIKGYSGNELEYPNVPKVYLAAPESTPDNPVLVPFTYGEAVEDVEIVPDFSVGDMSVTVPDGYLARSAVVKKPDSLIPVNIKKGESIAGVTGEYEGTIQKSEEVTIAADFSGGDVVVTPVEGSMFSKVTVQKPETLRPENIAEGVDIAGIVGTLGAGAKVKSVEYRTLSTDLSAGGRISVDFGFVPDFILMYTLYTGQHSNYSSSYGRVFMGFSTAGDAVSGAYPITAVMYQSDKTLSHKSGYNGIEVAGTASSDPIYGADETGFNIGVKKLKSYNTYYIFAIKFT